MTDTPKKRFTVSVIYREGLKEFTYSDCTYTGVNDRWLFVKQTDTETFISLDEIVQYSIETIHN